MPVSPPEWKRARNAHFGIHRRRRPELRRLRDLHDTRSQRRRRPGTGREARRAGDGGRPRILERSGRQPLEPGGRGVSQRRPHPFRFLGRGLLRRARQLHPRLYHAVRLFRARRRSGDVDVPRSSVGPGRGKRRGVLSAASRRRHARERQEPARGRLGRPRRRGRNAVVVFEPRPGLRRSPEADARRPGRVDRLGRIGRRPDQQQLRHLHARRHLDGGADDRRPRGPGARVLHCRVQHLGDARPVTQPRAVGRPREGDPHRRCRRARKRRPVARFRQRLRAGAPRRQPGVYLEPLQAPCGRPAAGPHDRRRHNARLRRRGGHAVSSDARLDRLSRGPQRRDRARQRAEARGDRSLRQCLVPDARSRDRLAEAEREPDRPARQRERGGASGVRRSRARKVGRPRRRCGRSLGPAAVRPRRARRPDRLPGSGLTGAAVALDPGGASGIDFLELRRRGGRLQRVSQPRILPGRPLDPGRHRRGRPPGD